MQQGADDAGGLELMAVASVGAVRRQPQGRRAIALPDVPLVHAPEQTRNSINVQLPPTLLLKLVTTLSQSLSFTACD